MVFAGLNYLAIVIAAVAGWLVGAIWYGALFSKPWMAANGISAESMKARGVSPLPFIVSFVALVAMAWVLAGILGHLGPAQVTARNGIVSAAFLWAGFVLTTMAVNNTFAGRKPMLLAIDGGHWLTVMAVMGAVIGWFGV